MHTNHGDRSRFVRLWFALRLYRVQALIPVLRAPEAYRRYLQHVLPALPADPLREDFG